MTSHKTSVELEASAPSIVGMYGLAGAAFLLSLDTAHWFGGGYQILLMAPLAALFAYEAGHVLGAAADRKWGSFWMANTVLAWMLSTGTGVRPHGGYDPGPGWAFILVAAATFGCLACALPESKALAAVLASLAAGSAVSGIALLAGNERLLVLAEYLFAMAAVAAWYTASALLVNQTCGREAFSVGRRTHAREMLAVHMARHDRAA